MYNKFFGLVNDPFRITPDPRNLYLSRTHREAIAGLTYAIVVRRKGFAVLIGDAGLGKSTVVNRMLQGASSRIRASVISHPTVNPDDFLSMALRGFGIASPQGKAERLHLLREHLHRWAHQDLVPILVVDEAHQLSPEALEEVRLLGNMEQPDRKLLQIVLAGHPELDQILNQPELRQLKQRVSVRMTLEPLPKEDVGPYLVYRWQNSGGPLPLPITTAAVERIAVASAGIPRVINTISDNALLVAFAEDCRTVTPTHIDEACADLGLFDALAQATGAASAPLLLKKTAHR